MTKLRPTIMATAFLMVCAGTSLADGHQARDVALREVEVSLWELVACAMYHVADPTAEGAIRNGYDAGTTPFQEFEKQMDDVEEHWAAFKDATDDNDREAIEAFEAAYAMFLKEAEKAMALRTVMGVLSEEQQQQIIKMWVAAHHVDNIIDDRLQLGSIR